MNKIQTIKLAIPVPVLTLTLTRPTVHHLLSVMITFVILVILDLIIEKEYNNNYYPDNDPLWDGEGCGPTSICCDFNNPPWFCKTLPQPTSARLKLGSDNFI